MKNKNQENNWMNKDVDELFQAVLKIKNIKEAKMFFRDLLTENEIMEFAQRWKVARMLDSEVPYLEIGRQTWMSPRTIARIKQWLKNGKGGYRFMIDRMKHL